MHTTANVSTYALLSNGAFRRSVIHVVIEKSPGGPVVRKPDARSVRPVVPPADWRGKSVVAEIFRIWEIGVVVAQDGVPSVFEEECHFLEIRLG